jgi:uroporphyrinogen-III synthase
LIVSTRREPRGGVFARAIARASLRLWSVPTTEVDVGNRLAAMTRVLDAIGDVDWLVFTSPRAVDLCCGHRRFPSRWRGLPRPPRVAAVGPVTAARLAHYGLSIALTPLRAGGAHLARALVATADRAGTPCRILWPRAAGAGPWLRQALRAAGHSVVDPVVYAIDEASPARVRELRRALRERRVWALCFWSPSAARGLAAGLGEPDLTSLARRRVIIASIGPTTSAALQDLGAPQDIEAERPDGAALAQALVARAAGGSR